jgi:hypothetical protein
MEIRVYGEDLSWGDYTWIRGPEILPRLVVLSPVVVSVPLCIMFVSQVLRLFGLECTLFVFVCCTLVEPSNFLCLFLFLIYPSLRKRPRALR